VLTPQEVEEFFAILRRMREQGKTVVIITHKLSEVLAISDEVTVMRDGKVVGGLQTKQTNAADLARMMVGREVLLRVEKPEPKVGQPTLTVNGLSVKRADGSKRVDNISLKVRREILGIAGVEGKGQTELIEALAGLVNPAQLCVKIVVDGRDITREGARLRRELGIAHIPEDRHRRGLLLEFDLAENSILGVHYRKPIVSLGGVFLDGSAVAQRAREIIEGYDVRPANAESCAHSRQPAEVDNRQEVMLNPKLPLVSQPTRGVDIGAIEFIHRKLSICRQRLCGLVSFSGARRSNAALIGC
jgi:simple sugar transport system ATP-binding protein